MEIHEPCQVGDEAALSGTFHVTLGSLGVAVCRGIFDCFYNEAEIRGIS